MPFSSGRFDVRVLPRRHRAYCSAKDGPALEWALNATIDTFPFTVIDASGKTGKSNQTTCIGATP